MQYLALIQLIVELIAKYGVPAYSKIVEAWDVKDEELLAKIQALKGTLPEPESFFEEEEV
jgi:hypothetical protein